MGLTRLALQLGHRSADWRNRSCSIQDFRKRSMLVYVDETDPHPDYDNCAVTMLKS